MGCSGNGTNPEQLFAIGYAACFHSALRLVGRQEKTDISDSAVGAGFARLVARYRPGHRTTR
jgi:organic hydroperoxide reductase OsmC/OhrA